VLVSATRTSDDKDMIDFWANMTDGWEWTLGLLHLAYFATFSYEFSQITGTELKVSVDNKSVNSEVNNFDVTVKSRDQQMSQRSSMSSDF